MNWQMTFVKLFRFYEDEEYYFSHNWLKPVYGLYAY
jgi:hypothetical protein